MCMWRVHGLLENDMECPVSDARLLLLCIRGVASAKASSLARVFLLQQAREVFAHQGRKIQSKISNRYDGDCRLAIDIVKEQFELISKRYKLSACTNGQIADTAGPLQSSIIIDLVYI